MQGFNMGRYVPPEHEGTISANALAGKHALGARARKIKDGILTVRFEMPFAIWCTTCPKPSIIGQGVRFNAEKQKVGAYFSTPVYAFRMKHIACGGAIEIRTDPKNTAYVVVEGAKKRDHGEDKVREGEEGVEILTAEERERRREDAFAMLEGKVQEKTVEKDSKRRIADLEEAGKRDWEDPYEASRRVRRGFRADRRVRVKNEKIAEGIKDRMGLDIDLLPEVEEDRQRAALVVFGGLSDSAADGPVNMPYKPLFNSGSASKRTGTARPSNKVTREAKAAAEAEDKRKALQQSLRGATLAMQDPFSITGDIRRQHAKAGQAFIGLRRKQVTGNDKATTPVAESPLVAYDSD